MADKVIKSFTIGSDSCTIDWTDGVANKPTIPSQTDITALQTAVAAITPKKTTVSWSDANVSKVSVYNYFQSSTVNSGTEDITTGSTLMARDGDFGYPCIDGTGQLNLVPSLATGYDMATFTTSDTTAYKNLKTPYLTCVDNLYRITKITKDFNITAIAAGTEPTTGGAPVTFTIVKPADYSGADPVVKQYRTKDAMLCNTTTTAAATGYKPTTLTFTSGACSTQAYSKDSGYPQAGDGNTAQLNFTIDCELATGYTMSVVATVGTYKNFNVPGYTDEDTGITFTNQYQVTKINDTVTAENPLAITITIAAPATVTYTTSSAENAYSFSSDSTEIPGTVGKGSPLVFAFYHQVNKQNPTNTTTCLPDGTDCGGSGALPTSANMLSGDHPRISSVTIGGTAYTLTADMIKIAGKKATVTIPGSATTGDIVITLGAYTAS